METSRVETHDIHRRSALVLYGSETGNAQDLAAEIGKLCERIRFVTQVCALDDIDLQQLLKHTVVLFSISTTGQGQLPANSQRFWKRLRSARLPSSCLSAVQFSSFGLGDTSYPQFNYAHRKLYNRLVQLGAQPFHDRGEGDEQHPEGVDGTFLPWSIALRTSLLGLFPLPPGVDPIEDTVLIRPKWHLEQVESNGSTSQAPKVNNDNDEPAEDLIPVVNGMVATVHANERVTPTTHFQDTRHLVFTVPNHHDYPPGAVMTIYPKNFPSDVSLFLELMSWTDIADRPLQFVSEADGRGQPPPIRSLHLTLRILLTNHLDIMAIPRRSFFANLLHYTNDDMHLERLREFVSPDLLDELYDYTTRPRRSILETLSDFPKVKLPWQDVCSIIPLMRGRQFSIASGGSLKSVKSLTHSDIEIPSQSTRVDLLVAIVKYRTIIKRIRQGVATRYIATLRPGQQITVTMQPGGLGLQRDDFRKPMVMIGPGTGIAPVRAIVYERARWKETLRQHHDSVKDVIFFGCRNKNVDEYFRDEWSAFDVTVFSAYSRDQREKVYVQDLIRRNGPQVYSLLAERGGIVFVCGSSGRMPQAVRQALTDAFVEHGPMSLIDAEGYFVKLEKESRYLQETW